MLPESVQGQPGGPAQGAQVPGRQGPRPYHSPRHRGRLRVSLAAISYHFHTTEALLNEASLQAIGEWGSAAGADPCQGSPTQRRDTGHRRGGLKRVIGSFRDDLGVLAASYEHVVPGRGITCGRQPPGGRDRGGQRQARSGRAGLAQSSEAPEATVGISWPELTSATIVRRAWARSWPAGACSGSISHCAITPESSAR
jgi:hypothetical protein